MVSIVGDFPPDPSQVMVTVLAWRPYPASFIPPPLGRAYHCPAPRRSSSLAPGLFQGRWISAGREAANNSAFAPTHCTISFIFLSALFPLFVVFSHPYLWNHYNNLFHFQPMSMTALSCCLAQMRTTILFLSTSSRLMKTQTTLFAFTNQHIGINSKFDSDFCLGRHSQQRSRSQFLVKVPCVPSGLCATLLFSTRMRHSESMFNE